MRRPLLLAVLLLSACGTKTPAVPEEAVVEAAGGELRFRSYAAAIEEGRPVRVSGQAAWAETVAEEMRAMAPVFTRGRAIALPFDKTSEQLGARAWTYRGRDYLVLVNREDKSAQKLPAAALKPSWRPLFEKRRDPRELLMEHNGTHFLMPRQVLVLESRIKLRRVFGLD